MALLAADVAFSSACLHSVKSGTGQQTSREMTVVLLRELHRAVIYTTEMTKQVTKSHVRDAVHMQFTVYLELRCQADTFEKKIRNPGML
jgi:hypothetical protein